MNKRRKSGFTLIELMLVVVIIGIIVGIVVPRLSGRRQQANIAATKHAISSTELGLDSFELDVGRFPSTEEGLSALMEKPPSITDDDVWKGPYMKKWPRDSWRHDFVYKYPGEEGVDYDIISGGGDGQIGNEDDITNYEKDHE